MSNRFLVALTATLLSCAAASPGVAADSVKIGALRCEVSGGLGLIVTSSKQMTCDYAALNGRKERYLGTISKFGLDIGKTDRGVLAWDVFAPTSGPPAGALAGDYVGVNASATIGAGLGANVLVGGFNRSIALQPLSVEAQTGLALSAGVASLTLTSAK